VRYIEGEVIHVLSKKVDMGDVRVNEIKALVIPTSKNIVRGSDFSAQIILAAVDSTQRPQIYIDDTLLDAENGEYAVRCDRTGDYTLNGYMLVNDGAGMQTRYDFTQNYTVVDPTATVSASLMNVLYAGYSNPVSISVPGVPANKIAARITKGEGSIKSDGKNGYIVVPTKIGEELMIGVTARNDEGRDQSMGEYAFRVRQLPDPTPFIEYKDKDGNTQRYRGGTKFSKQALMGTNGIIAAIDDGLLNIGFKVLSFETVFYDNMGNAIPLMSQGAQFSQQQKDMFRNLGRGKRFYISHVKAVGPDNVERLLPTSLEVIID
jgi:gliding motility-associated protein GldM